MFITEKIPDEDKLYRRVHQQYIVEGEISSRAFKESKGGMSTDWKKYCNTAEEARLMAKKFPEQNGVVSFITGELRKEELQVIHIPSDNHKSHADVRGVDALALDVERRYVLLEMFTWEIHI